WAAFLFAEVAIRQALVAWIGPVFPTRVRIHVRLLIAWALAIRRIARHATCIVTAWAAIVERAIIATRAAIVERAIILARAGIVGRAFIAPGATFVDWAIVWSGPRFIDRAFFRPGARFISWPPIAAWPASSCGPRSS